MTRPYHKFSSLEVENAVQLYRGGQSVSQVARKVGRTKGGIAHLLRRCNEPRRPNRQHHFNEDFFSSIRTEEQAYWLGFLTADGCVTRYAVRLCLGLKDRSHLEKFKVALEYPGAVQENERRVALDISSVRLNRGLRRLGVLPRKSLKETPCTEVPEDLLRHYWRGVVDGDGSIWSRTPPRCKTPYWVVALYGSAEIVAGFKAFLKRKGVETNAKVHRKGNGLSVLQVGGNGVAIDAMQLLYKGAQVYLTRKFLLAMEAISAHRI